jgi:hypothetical protein
MTTKRLIYFGAESSARKLKATVIYRKGESININKLRLICRKGKSISIKLIYRTILILSLIYKKGESQGII